MDSSNTVNGSLGVSTAPVNFIQKKNFYVTEVENGYTIACRNIKDYGEKVNVATTKEEVLKIISDYLS